MKAKKSRFARLFGVYHKGDKVRCLVTYNARGGGVLQFLKNKVYVVSEKCTRHDSTLFVEKDENGRPNGWGKKNFEPVYE